MASPQQSVVVYEQLVARLKQIHDLYRTARLNELYYQHRVNSYRKWNLCIEVLTALTTSTAIGGLTFWKSNTGSMIWTVLVSVPVVLTVVKPFLQLSDLIEQSSKRHSEYRSLFLDLQELEGQITLRQGLDDSLLLKFEDALNRSKRLGLQDEVNVSERLRRKCFDAVGLELPVSSLWMPTRKEG